MQLKSSASGRSACVRPRTASRQVSVRVRADKCLIVGTKGGGHAFITLYLAKELVNRGHDVTIFQQGDQVGRRPAGEANRSVPGNTLYWISHSEVVELHQQNLNAAGHYKDHLHSSLFTSTPRAQMKACLIRSSCCRQRLAARTHALSTAVCVV